MDAPQSNLAAPQTPATMPVHLGASRRKASGRGIFPRIPEDSPAAPRFDPIELSATAVLYSYTVIHPNPKSGQPPFALAYADFPEAVRVFGRLVLPDGDRPRIGMSVQPVRPTGAVDDGYIFVPAEGEIA